MNHPVTVASIATLPLRMQVAPDLAVHGAAGEHSFSGFLLVRVELSNGVVGYGEVSATPKWSGEDEATAAHFIQHLLAPALIGTAIDEIERADRIMDDRLGGNMFTKSGLSIALWDAYARTRDVALAEALGGVRRREVRIKCSLSGTSEQMRRAHAYAVSMGFSSFKVKVGLDLPGDIARVALARELTGPGAFIGSDANTGWTRADAALAIEAFAPYGIAFVEQPLAAKDLEGMASLRGRGVPIVADESVGDLWDLRSVIAGGAADVVSLYVGMSGGPARAVAMGVEAAAAGLDVVIGSNGEMGIGAAAQLQVACALPELSTSIPSDIIGSHFYLEETLDHPLRSNGSTVVLGDGAGLGVMPRPDLVEALEREAARRG